MTSRTPAFSILAIGMVVLVVGLVLTIVPGPGLLVAVAGALVVIAGLTVLMIQHRPDPVDGPPADGRGTPGR